MDVRRWGLHATRAERREIYIWVKVIPTGDLYAV